MNIYNYRKSAGAALGLVAASLFIIVAIGTFMFYAACLLGGSSQLNKASDAGILNVAKNALVSPAIAFNDPYIQLPPAIPNIPTNTYMDFAVGNPGDYNCLADQTINNAHAVDLLTYNRCAAQGVLVSLQAQKINNTTAYLNADEVCNALWNLAHGLQMQFIGLQDEKINNFYDTETAANNLNFLGLGSSPEVTRQDDIRPAFINPGRPSNIYFSS